MSKRIVIFSMALAGIVGFAAVIDMFTQFPFGRVSLVMDITFLIGSLVVLYMAYETIDELK